jgi:hypothetical protein
VIRLENLEDLEPSGLREEAQGELEELASLLRAEGLEAYVAGTEESVQAHLQHSAEQVAVEVFNVVLEHGLDAALTLLLEEVIRRWAKRRRFFRNRDGARATVYFWDDKNEILKIIELPEPADDERED